MKVKDVRPLRPYLGMADADGMVDVYDITVPRTHLYCVAGIIVSNSKRISMLDVNALMAHGATENLRDIGAFRGQKDDHRWLQFMMGHNPSQVKVPQVFNKFINYLKASGINVIREGNQTHLLAMTNKDVQHLAGDRVLEHGDTVRFDKDLRPIPGGLFDPQLTGGHGGQQWSKIKLEEGIPSPVMEEPIRGTLGLTKKKFEGVISGAEPLGSYGHGFEAISKALDDINLPKEIGRARVQMQTAMRSKRDEAIRRLGFLKHTDELGMHPRDWVLDHAPVLPPVYRPVSMMGTSNLPLVSDPNYLYKELMEANKNLGEMKKRVGDEGAGPERLALYHSLKAVTGLSDPIHPKLQEKGVKGMLKSIFGSSPKFGTVQRKLLSSTVDNVGRSVVTPDPDLNMDQVGLPENQAFTIYQKFIARKLHRSGMPLSKALEEIENKTDLARSVLQQEMEERPVYVNRAPVLHKFGILAFKPHLVKGDVLKVSPLVVKGFNMDFDGDAVQMHVPTTPEAIQEAHERMLPSKNLIAVSDFKSPVHVPGQEYQGGLYHASSSKSKRRPRIYNDRREVAAAHARGDIGVDDPVHIVG